MADTTIKVGVTELDQYGNLFVTPTGGGDRIKIGVKRKELHPLFTQGATILLHWETYMNKPYVAGAELVEKPAQEDHLVEEAIKLGAKETSGGTTVVKEEAGEPITRDPHNRSYALSYAKDVTVAKIGKGLETSADKTIEIAKRFNRYLDTGE